MVGGLPKKIGLWGGDLSSPLFTHGYPPQCESTLTQSEKALHKRPPSLKAGHPSRIPLHSLHWHISG